MKRESASESRESVCNTARVGRAKKQTIEALAAVYAEVRALQIPGLEIKANGAVYQKRNGILHFHEDGTGVQADVKVNGEWQRVEVNDAAGKRKVVALLKRHYAGGPDSFGA
jgi:hypothetical protein